jgi:hypothetical protein
VRPAIPLRPLELTGPVHHHAGIERFAVESSRRPGTPAYEATTIEMFKFKLRRIAVAGVIVAVCMAAGVSRAKAHGGVMVEEDICVIKMGFLTAHFTIYQPETSASREFCEDIPDVTHTVFVMDYLHNSLREMPLEFRIIKDITGAGVFAKSEDVAAIDDDELEPATVFYAPPRIRRDATFTVEHRFTEPGWYIGIVTTHSPVNGKDYQTVFPFHVGTEYGYLPLFLLMGAAAQIAYLVYSGTAARWWSRLSRRS